MNISLEEVDVIEGGEQLMYLFSEPYIFYNVTVWNRIIIDGESFDASYQGGSYYHNDDYSTPSNELHIYDDGSSDLINVVDGMYEKDFDPQNEDQKEHLQEKLEEVKEECASIDTVEKFLELYLFLMDSAPNVCALGFDEDDEEKIKKLQEEEELENKMMEENQADQFGETA